jgi:mannose-6-phosphate isomerase-like protein (cupin superfamily)
MRVSAEGNQPPLAGSALAVETIELPPAGRLGVDAGDADTIVLVAAGADGQSAGVAQLVLAGEQESLVAGAAGMTVLRATIGPGTDRHAALGPRARTVSVADLAAESATGNRSFEILFGPHNGATRATLFVGHVPPGAAPWHFHLYDEIVWIWRGEGCFHTREGSEPLGPGSAFRIRPREVHVVENTSPTEELVVVGLFTPAGSPSAAYYAEDSDIPYPIGEAS